MILTIIFTLCFAKYKKLKITPLFKNLWLLPILILELVHLVFQIAAFHSIYIFIPYAGLLKRLYLYALLLPIIRYGLYQSALLGSLSILLGTLLNKIVMHANSGLMPVYPSVSKWTGYFNATPFTTYDSIHVLGDANTKLKFLSDYIDTGFSILSPGDLLIHAFSFIVLYSTIKKLQIH